MNETTDQPRLIHYDSSVQYRKNNQFFCGIDHYPGAELTTNVELITCKECHNKLCQLVCERK